RHSPGARGPAPGRPPGHVLLGYDERGRCPMLTDAGCSIYEHRPRTCRTYDCRVFPAAGVVPDDKPRVAERAARWRFGYGTPGDEWRHAAVRATAAELRGDATMSTTEVAVRAVSAHVRGEPARGRGSRLPRPGAGSETSGAGSATPSG
ncbi:MAG TPA: YkgJ family cysteine cluster protein, partial [Acidimicrobiales bacterium]